MSRLRLFTYTAAVVTGAFLLAAAPAYADVAPVSTSTTAVWILVLGGCAVVIVGGLSFVALRKTAARRREQAARERSRQPTDDDREGSE